jgi:AmmeMemoRadiSam system protein A
MDRSQEEMLLALARETIRARLTNDPLPSPKDVEVDKPEYGGVFVTMKNRGQLRGCIGSFKPSGTLPEAIQQSALGSLDDPRFRHAPVTLQELPQIRIEISVLSALTKTDDPLSLEIGVHGIFIRRGWQSGCFLPQVATELGWDARTFLSKCCEGKAGMHPDAWKESETEVHLFSADVFGED